MPDSEVIKVLIQLGSFGLLAIITVWLLWKGAPMLRDTLVKMEADHSTTIEKLTVDCRNERKEEREWRKEMQSSFTNYIESLESMKLVPR